MRYVEAPIQVHQLCKQKLPWFLFRDLSEGKKAARIADCKLIKKTDCFLV